MTSEMATVSIGSNIDRERNITAALTQLQQRFNWLQCSSIYETDAVGFEGMPFYNLVARFRTTAPPSALKNLFKKLEAAQGRQRGGEKFASRSLDIDLLLYGNLVQQNEDITLPHADILRYGFVLEPLAELAPEQLYPGSKSTFDALWRQFRQQNNPHRAKKLDWQPLPAAGKATV